MGGGNIGDASISISADLTNFVKSLGQAEASVKKFAENISRLDVKLLPEGLAKDAQEVVKALGDLQIAAQAPGLDQLTAKGDRASVAMDRISKASKNAADNTKKVTAAEAEAAKLRAMNVPQVSAAEKAIRSFGLAQIEAAKSNEVFNRVKAGGFTGFLARVNAAIEGVNPKLAKFGLTTRDIGIILGSGFLSGGIALVARQLIELGKAAVQAFIDLGRIGTEFERLTAQMQTTFGPGADIIREFSQTSADSLGLSQRAALTLTSQLGLLFQSFGIGKQQSAQFALSLTQVAEVFKRVYPGAGTFETVLRDIQGTLTGNIEALRKYGVSVSEVSLRQTALAHGIQVGTGEIDAQLKSILALLFTYDEAQKKFDDFGKVSINTATAEERLAASFDDLKVRLAKAVAPTFERIVEAIINFVDTLDRAVVGTQNFVDEHPHLIQALKDLGTVMVALAKTNLGIIVKALATQLTVAADSAERLADLLDKLPFIDFSDDADKATAALERKRKEEEKDLELQRNIAEQEKEAEKVARDLVRNRELTIEQLRRLRDLHERLAEVQEDGAKRIKDAEERLAETIEDAAKRARDATKRLSEAVRDRNRAIIDAAEKIREVEEENAERIGDAREKVREAQEDALKSIRDAEEDLRDARIDAARRVEDAEDALADARRQRLEQILDAQLSLEQAIRQGDVFAERSAALQLSRAKRGEGVANAQEQLAEAIREANESIADAEEKLAETRIEAAERVAEAQEDLADTFKEARERMKDAEREYADTVVEQNERVKEAQESLAEAEEENNKRIADARENLVDTQENVRDAIKDAKEALQDTNDELGTHDLTLAQILDKYERMLTTVQRIRREWEQGIGGGGSSRGHGVSGEWQHGGPIRRGQVGLVGEVGPELFIPHTSGTIVSNDQLMKALRELSRNGGSSQSITVVDSGDPEATAFMVAHRLMSGVNN